MEWDAIDNSKRYRKVKFECERCGADAHCISSEGLEDYEDYRDLNVCHACYDEIAGQTECHRSNSECRGCKHYDPEYNL